MTLTPVVEGPWRPQRSPATDARRAEPNAKSVSERIWQMSHHVRPNPANASHTLASRALILQEDVQPFHAYNVWCWSQHVRPNTLATP